MAPAAAHALTPGAELTWPPAAGCCTWSTLDHGSGEHSGYGLPELEPEVEGGPWARGLWEWREGVREVAGWPYSEVEDTERAVSAGR